MTKEEFIFELNKIGIKLTNKQLDQLDKYYKLLIEWNTKINLTRIVKEKDVYLKHFYDSLTLIKAIDLNKDLTVCDVGTGAGFPGMVLKIVFPNLKVTLLDSLLKRIKFLNIVIEELNLEDIIAVHDRAENYLVKNSFDLITCRAVAKLELISKMCIKGLKQDGYFIPMKANIDEEIKDTNYLSKLGAKIENVITFKLPIENSIRNLIVIKKIKV